MITKLATFRGVTSRGDPLVRVFRQGDSVTKVAGTLMPPIQEWLGAYKSDSRKIAILVNALGASEFWGQNVNGDIFPEGALIHDCRCHPNEQHPVDDFSGKVVPPYGYWTFLNAFPYVHHRNKDPTRAFGKVAVTCWNPSMHRVELVVLIDRHLAMQHDAQHVVDRIDRGDYPDCSMGCRVPWDQCTICGHKSKTRNDYCSCIKNIGMGKILDDGRQIGVINTYPRFFDISFVFIGADKTAKMMCKLGAAGVPQSVLDADQVYNFEETPDGIIKAACGRKGGCTECRGKCKTAGLRDRLIEAGIGATAGAGVGGLAGGDGQRAKGALLGAAAGAVGGLGGAALFRKGVVHRASRRLARQRAEVAKREDALKKFYQTGDELRRRGRQPGANLDEINREWDERFIKMRGLDEAVNDARAKLDFVSRARAEIASRNPVINRVMAMGGGSAAGAISALARGPEKVDLGNTKTAGPDDDKDKLIAGLRGAAAGAVAGHTPAEAVLRAARGAATRVGLSAAKDPLKVKGVPKKLSQKQEGRMAKELLKKVSAEQSRFTAEVYSEGTGEPTQHKRLTKETDDGLSKTILQRFAPPPPSSQTVYGREDPQDDEGVRILPTNEDMPTDGVEDDAKLSSAISHALPHAVERIYKLRGHPETIEGLDKQLLMMQAAGSWGASRGIRSSIDGDGPEWLKVKGVPGSLEKEKLKKEMDKSEVSVRSLKKEGVAIPRPISAVRYALPFSSPVLPILGGAALGGATMLGSALIASGPEGRKRLSKEVHDPRLYSNLRGMVTGESRAERVGAHKQLERGEQESVLDAMRSGFGRKKLSAAFKMGPPPSPNRDKFPFVGTINFRGLIIYVENAPGTWRTGPGWKTLMKVPYGEFARSLGTDGDKLDVYVGPDKNCENVFIVHQNYVYGPKKGQYDEDKVMLGFGTAAQAKKAYLAHYDSPKFFRSITTMAFPLFKKALLRKEVDGEKVASRRGEIMDFYLARARGESPKPPGGVDRRDRVTSYYLEKTAESLRLEDLFDSATTENSVRRERTWRDKTTNKETNVTGSGMGSWEKTKTASVKVCSPMDLYKLSTEDKEAAKRKWAEIIKEVGPSKAVGQTSPLLSASEPSIPREALDAMGAKGLESALATPSLMGMVLKPREFQRISLVHMGKKDLADQLDDAGACFRPRMGEEGPCSSLEPHHADMDLLKMLLPLLSQRSYFGPVVRRRIIRITMVKPKPLAPEQEVDSPLLSKVASAYNWYRREQIKVAASSVEKVTAMPELHAAVHGLEDGDLFKTAALPDKATMGLMLGAVPLTLMYSAHLRSEQEKGRELGTLSRFVADHPWLTSLAAMSGTRALMETPAARQKIDEGIRRAAGAANVLRGH